MNLVLTQEGAEYLWSVLVLGAAVKPLEVRLLGSAYTPSHADTYYSLLAHELVCPGYAPIALPAGSAGWTLAPIPQGADVLNQAPVWNLMAPCIIYGGWLDLPSLSESLFAWVFDAPYIFPTTGTFYLTLNPSLISAP